MSGVGRLVQAVAATVPEKPLIGRELKASSKQFAWHGHKTAVAIVSRFLALKHCSTGAYPATVASFALSPTDENELMRVPLVPWFRRCRNQWRR